MSALQKANFVPFPNKSVVVIAITAPSSCGKTTQVEGLVKRLENTGLQIAVISVSNLLWNYQDENGAYPYRQIIKAGGLVQEEATTNRVTQEIDKLKKLYDIIIIDGHPRSKKAAKLMSRIYDWVFFLDVSRQEQKRRFVAQSKEGRNDGSKKAIRNRLRGRRKVYAAAKVFAELGIANYIDANGTQEETATRLFWTVKNFLQRERLGAGA